MKRISLTICILFAVSIAVFAQQAARPTTAQTKDEATQYLGQVKSNADEHDTTLADLYARNTSNNDAANYRQLKADIEKLEATINSESAKVRVSLDAGAKVNPELFQRLERMIAQHKSKMRELEAFTKQK